MTEELLIYQAVLDDYVTGLSWSTGTSSVVAATAGGRVYGILPTEGKVIFRIDAHKNGVLSISTSPTENKIVSSGQGKIIKLWSGSDGSILREVSTEHWIEMVCWSPDGEFFAVSSGKSFILFDREGNEVTRSGVHGSTVAAIAWRPDSKQLATASYGGVRVYDFGSGKFELLECKNSLISLTWSPDGRFVMAGTQDNAIHVWQMSAPERRDIAMHGYPNKVRSFAWDMSGKNVATNCGLDIVVWNTDHQNGPENTKPIVIEAHAAKVTALDYQPGENMLVSGDESGRLFFWININGDHRPLDNISLNSAIAKLRWNKDGSQLVAGTSNGTIAVFEY